MEFDIVVPVYVASPALYPIIERFFESLQEHYPEITVYGIDDASPLPCPPHWPIVARNAINKGFTATVNYGLSLTNKPVIVVCNDDLTITMGDLNRFNTLRGMMIASPMDTASSSDDRFGSCWGMTREVYEQLGPLNEHFRNYFSDLDYYNRAKEAGILIEKWYDITIEHVESATFNLVDKKTLFEEDERQWNQLP